MRSDLQGQQYTLHTTHFKLEHPEETYAGIAKPTHTCQLVQKSNPEPFYCEGRVLTTLRLKC